MVNNSKFNTTKNLKFDVEHFIDKKRTDNTKFGILTVQTVCDAKITLAPMYRGGVCRRPAAQNVTPKNGYGTPGERRQDG